MTLSINECGTESRTQRRKHHDPAPPIRAEAETGEAVKRKKMKPQFAYARLSMDDEPVILELSLYRGDPILSRYGGPLVIVRITEVPKLRKARKQ